MKKRRGFAARAKRGPFDLNFLAFPASCQQLLPFQSMKSYSISPSSNDQINNIRSPVSIIILIQPHPFNGVKLNICSAHLHKLINRSNAHHITLYSVLSRLASVGLVSTGFV